MKLTGAAILVSRAMNVLQAAPAAYPYRQAIGAGCRSINGYKGRTNAPPLHHPPFALAATLQGSVAQHEAATVN
jgi:hypothetical protein